MSHTLHRRGTPENLAHDFPMHAMPARGFNHEGAQPKLQEFLRIAHGNNPVNLGDVKLGNQFVTDYDELHEKLTISSTHAVLANESDLVTLLQEVKEAELGMSLTISGLFDKLFACCAHAGIQPHAVEHSLGVLGKTEKMPEDEIAQVTSMCGHAMVAQGLVRRLIRQVKKGTITPEEAGVELAKPCRCGIFNPVRAATLIDEYCALYTVSDR
ncbi:hypothetical protein SRRS_49070 [Sporomusa rhizae]|uniref:hypothetical protein n=1 Tax=Sporomusa rhizae TaxID=357999 RepID=UPI00352B47C0